MPTSFVNNFQDFLSQYADSKCMTREEYTAYFLSEGVMSNIHLMADASKDWDDFLKKFKKEYKKVFQNTPDFMDWLYGMYKDMAPTKAGEKVEEGDELYGSKVKLFEQFITEGIYAKESKVVPGEYIMTQYGYFYKRVEGKVGGQDAYVEIKKGKEGKRKTSIHDTVDFDIVDKSRALGESLVAEGKMPKKHIGNDEIVYLKTKEDSRGAHYNLYYKGHDIEMGGVRFGSEKELKDFAANYILSNQWYNKLRYEDAKPLPESFISENISQDGYALNRLADNQVGGVPATEFQEEHNLDLEALTRAITHTKEITRYELRDIIKGTAPKSKIKNFLIRYSK